MSHSAAPFEEHGQSSKTVFGFWIYLLTDFMMFAVLLATYLVLQRGSAFSFFPRDLFPLSGVLARTFTMLGCSLGCGLARVFVCRGQLNKGMGWFGAAFALGLLFLWMQGGEFSQLIRSGHGWEKSAVSSAYFTLLGTFCLHMIFAVLWIPVLALLLRTQGDSLRLRTRFVCLTMFWHFLQMVWVFIFSVVYLMGG